jgi:hypothetical protein
MKHPRVRFAWSLVPVRQLGLAAAAAASLLFTACGGGGGAAPPAEATVLRVDAASVLEGSGSSTSDLNFLVTLDKPVITRLELRISTISLIKPGFASTPGAAKGGASCGDDVDYIQQQDQPLVFAAGASSGLITVKVCHDAKFEPNETLDVTWKTVGGESKTVTGLVINDDAGGPNGTGATARLAGLPFGRDVNALTKSNEDDGALGFSFAAVAGSPACILDKVTGLLWQASNYKKSDFDNMWRLELEANDAKLCGKSDWRVPRTNELLSVLNFSVPISTPSQPMNADTRLSADPMMGDFWTAEQVVNAPVNAWMVSPGTGGTVTFESKTKSTPFVRLVSGGIEPNETFPRASTCEDPFPRFEVSNGIVPNGTVYDQKSGLMWKQCHEGRMGPQCSEPSIPGFSTNMTSPSEFANWLSIVNDKPDTLGAGFSDWRIPTVKELASLVDRCIMSPKAPAINISVFPESKPIKYISSTAKANHSNSYWYVDFAGGTVAFEPPNSHYLRLVRAGQ